MKTYHTKLRSRRHICLNLVAIITLFFVSISFAGCSDDDDDNWQKTNTEGRPSKITSSEYGAAYFYYKSDKLVRIKEDGRSTLNFKYNNNELVEVTYSPTDKNIADGNGNTTFTKEGNIITVKSSGEPFWYTYTAEIELGDNGLPKKISDKTFKEAGPEGKDMIMAAPTYTLYTYDSSGKHLVEKRIYDVKTNILETIYTYTYDNKSGAANNNGLPAWYNIYSEDSYDYHFINLNYLNNLTKIEYTNVSQNYTVPTTFTNKYNDNGYPSLISTNTKDADEGSPSYTIEY